MGSSEDMGPRLARKRLLLAVVMLCCCGCKEFEKKEVPPVKLLLPVTIKIHDSSMVVRKEGGGDFDGLVVACEVRDGFGDSVKAWGIIRFEAYSYARSQPGNKGPRVGFWSVPIDSLEATQKYWDSIFGVYSFNLRWTRQVKLGERFIVEATLTTKAAEQFSDSQVLQARR